MTKYTNTNTNTQIHKYTNTAWVKVVDRPIMCYIFENTNTQIHKYGFSRGGGGGSKKFPRDIKSICSVMCLTFIYIFYQDGIM